MGWARISRGWGASPARRSRTIVLLASMLLSAVAIAPAARAANPIHLTGWSVVVNSDRSIDLTIGVGGGDGLGGNFSYWAYDCDDTNGNQVASGISRFGDEALRDGTTNVYDFHHTWPAAAEPTVNCHMYELRLYGADGSGYHLATAEAIVEAGFALSWTIVGSDPGPPETPRMPGVAWSVEMPSVGIPVTTPNGDVVASSCQTADSTLPGHQYLTRAGSVVWSDSLSSGPQPTGCALMTIDEAGNVYFPFAEDDGQEFFQSRDAGGRVRWTVALPAPTSYMQPVMGADGKVYVDLISAGTHQILGISKDTGALSSPVATTSFLTGLYAYNDGLIIISSAQVAYYSYDGALQNTYDPPIGPSGYSSALGNAGDVFISGIAGACGVDAHVTASKVTPSGVVWTWNDTAFAGCSQTIVAATPDGGAIVQGRLPGFTYWSLDEDGAERWRHEPNIPAGATESPQWLVRGAIVDVNGVVALPVSLTYPCQTEPSDVCHGFQFEFVTQASEALAMPTVHVGGPDSKLFEGSNLNGFEESPGPSAIAIDTDRLYYALQDHGPPAADGADLLAAFDVAGLGRQFPTRFGAPPPPPPLAVSVSPNEGRAGAAFTFSYECAGERELRVTKADGSAADGVTIGLATSGNGVDYTQSATVSVHGSYVGALECDGVTGTSSTFEVAPDRVLSILVLGDSYSAGNGAGDYFGDAGCWRSANNYARQFQRLVESTTTAQQVFVENRACGGAVTNDYWNPKDGRPAERDWVNNGYDAVFLTFGGNDIFFADIVQYCLVAQFRDGANCNSNLGRAESLIADGTMESRVEGVLRDIRQRSNPYAKVVLLGYPHLECDEAYTLRSGHGKKAPIIEVGRRVRQIVRDGDALQQRAVDRLNDEFGGGFTFVSTIDLFDGPPSHELCAQSTNKDRWMNQPQKDGGLKNREGWYHPNYTGHLEEAKMLFADARLPKASIA